MVMIRQSMPRPQPPSGAGDDGVEHVEVESPELGADFEAFSGVIVDMDYRLQAMIGMASEFTLALQANNANTTLIQLLADFTQFARDYFAYFALRAHPDAAIARTSEMMQAAVSPEVMRHDLSQITSRLQHEWANISRACEQRAMPAFATALNEANIIAADYYARFLGVKPPDVQPVTFFEKVYAIRRFAFTPRPLLSMPLQFVNDIKAGRGALAHELGHFIYWNAVPLHQYQRVHENLRNAVVAHFLNTLKGSAVDTAGYTRVHALIAIWLQWLEETFADICGALFVGPEYVLSAYKLFNESAYSLENVLRDDGEHPAWALRLLIPLEALTWALERLNITDANARLTMLRDEVSAIAANLADELIGSLPLTVADVRATIPAVVRLLLETARLWSKPNDSAQYALGAMIDLEPLRASITAYANNPRGVGDQYERFTTIMQGFKQMRPQIDDDSAFGAILRLLHDHFGDDLTDETLKVALLTLDLSEAKNLFCGEVKITHKYERMLDGRLRWCGSM